MTKNIQTYLNEANKDIKKITIEEAKLNSDNLVFLDVREKEELQNGKIPNSIFIPRGLLEFHADPNSPLYNPIFNTKKEIVIYCATGGRGALSTYTLKDMGYKNVKNLIGGLAKWIEGGGKID